MKILPYAQQSIDKNDIKKVVQVLKSNFLTQGPKVFEFEKAVKKYVNSKYAVAVNSATSALHIACLALDLKKNDLVWTSTNSFVASSNCALYCNAKIDFVDIDPKTFNISTDKLEAKLIKAKANKKIPKLLIVVHFAGNPCDMKKIYTLSKKYKFKIIEDASHAIGSRYFKKKIGNCRYSEMAIFSFHPIKIITTGEGGMVLTKNKKYFLKLVSLRNHGIVKNIGKYHNLKNSNWFYKQENLGFNYRMNDIEAALGISQIKKINKWVKKRNQMALYYKKNLSSIPVSFQEVNKNNFSSYHLFIIKINKWISKIRRNNLYYLLKSKNINTNVQYIPIHIHPFYKKLGFKKNDFPKAIDYYNNTLSLPLFINLKKSDLDRVINELKRIFKDIKK